MVPTPVVMVGAVNYRTSARSDGDHHAVREHLKKITENLHNEN